MCAFACMCACVLSVRLNVCVRRGGACAHVCTCVCVHLCACAHVCPGQTRKFRATWRTQDNDGQEEAAAAATAAAAVANEGRRQAAGQQRRAPRLRAHLGSTRKAATSSRVRMSDLGAQLAMEKLPMRMARRAGGMAVRAGSAGRQMSRVWAMRQCPPAAATGMTTCRQARAAGSVRQGAGPNPWSGGGADAAAEHRPLTGVCQAHVRACAPTCEVP